MRLLTQKLMLKALILLASMLLACCFGCQPKPAVNHTNNNPASCHLNAAASNKTSLLPTALDYKIVKRYAHRQDAFSQGLAYGNGLIYESTGHYGRSSVSIIKLDSGKVLQQTLLDKQYFGEGLTRINNQLIQLTWKSGDVFSYNAKTLALTNKQKVSGEGWGLTFDGESLISSNGTSTLTWRNPKTLEPVSTKTVFYGDRPLKNLNELEWVNGCILANLWHSDNIAVIEPTTGKTRFIIDLSPIARPERKTNKEHVANGIASIADTGNLLVTGKNWAYIYEIELLNH